MLGLDSEGWATLSHAYGIATDIPVLLTELAGLPPNDSNRAEPYFSLWGSLCHQGDVYAASYAAVPHIVAILESAPAQANEDFFHLPVWIEICRHKGHGPEIPPGLRNSYVDALAKLPGLAARVHTGTLSEEYVRVLAACIAVVGGQHALGEAILELEPAILKRFKEWAISW